MGSDEGFIETLNYNRKLKKAILDVMFREVETFYIHCMPSPKLVIGTRGLVEKEKEEGIILVLGPYSARRLDWDDEYIFGELQFNRWERIALPYECISRIFDKTGQVLMQWAVLAAPELLESTSDKNMQESDTTKSGKKRPGAVPIAIKEIGSNKVGNKKAGTSKKKSIDTGSPDSKPNASPNKVIEVDFSQKKPKK